MPAKSVSHLRSDTHSRGRGRRSAASRAAADFETVKWIYLRKKPAKRLRTSRTRAPGGSGGSHGPGAVWVIRYFINEYQDHEVTNEAYAILGSRPMLSGSPAA